MSSAEAWAEWIRRKLEEANGQPADQGQQASSGSGSGQQPLTTRSAQPAGGFSRHGGDESSPRRPGDPPWRGRTARRTSTPEAVRAFREGRRRRGWSLTQAAEETGVSRPHLSLLERGLRRPSESVAEDIIRAYQMTDAEAGAVSEIAVPWAGRDSPHRTGIAPGPW